jgi:polysaccharide deacetylase family protein (PEP-CTERM system associated)
MIHALSFDIEDWFHIVEIPELEDRSKWDSRSSIVEEKTDLILHILDRFEVKATFFVLGWVARKYPSISKKIVNKGHEIGTHSFWHRKVYDLTPDEFYKDLKLSIDILQDQTGQKVHGFRAPSFSIIPGTEWAFDVIKDVGLSYDASLFPAKRGQGGYNVQQSPHRLPDAISKTNMPELPMSVFKMGPVKIPFSGGGYLRFLPKRAIQFGFNNFEKKGLPAVVYLHPRDFAPDGPRVSMPMDRKFKSYTGLHTTEGKLEMLLEKYDFGTCEKILTGLF